MSPARKLTAGCRALTLSLCAGALYMVAGAFGLLNHVQDDG